MEEDRKVQKVPVGLAGLPKVLFVGEKNGPEIQTHTVRPGTEGTVLCRLKDVGGEI